MTAAKAWVAFVLGLLGPGAAYLAAAADNGVTTNEWIIALCFCLGGGAAGGAIVYAVPNQPKQLP